MATIDISGCPWPRIPSRSVRESVDRNRNMQKQVSLEQARHVARDTSLTDSQNLHRHRQ